MSHLNITVWPIDYMKSDLIVKPFNHMAWTDSKNKRIAQFELDIGSPHPTLQDCKAVMKEVSKYSCPAIPDIEQIRKKSVGNLSQIDSQFALKVVPHLHVPDLASFIDFTEKYGALKINEYPLAGIPENLRKKVHVQETFIKTKRELGSYIEYSEELALLMIRDLKAMSRHIIALSNEDNETTPWIEAGYEIPEGIEGREMCRALLHRRLDVGLKNFHLFSVFRLQEDTPIESTDINNLLSPGIYSIVCFQLCQFSNLHRPISQCAHSTCRTYFNTPTGYGKVRSHRSDSKFCSLRCARNSSQQRYRKNLKARMNK